jgi:tyrosine-specific transport protein
MSIKKFFYALSTLIGMIVGVGIFGIPYCFAQAGILAGFFYLFFMGAIILLIHLSYGEIVLRSGSNSRLVGYAQTYLGAWGKKTTTAIIVFEFYGAMLAYLIVGGQFLNISLGRFFGGSDFSWAIIFFSLGALAILLGLRTIGAIEFLMTAFLLLVAGVFMWQGVPLFQIENFKIIEWSNFFLPYGVILFSLTGGAAIPEMRQILKGAENRLKSAIIIGTLIPIIIYGLFALSVVGVSGSQTAKNAVEGLIPFLGDKIALIGAIFGFLAVMTSFLVVGLNLRHIFHFDYKINKYWAWVLACFVPLGAYGLGFNNFILIIGLVGAIAGGLEGILIGLIYRRAKKMGSRQPEYSLPLPKIVFYFLMTIFAIGVIYQFVYLAE